MLAIVSLTSMAGGTLLACFSDRLPKAAERAEMAGALLFVLGLVVIGAALPIYH